ncbi:MAG: hypothetical protein HeimC3_35460 [Candidatus Heimdallarchaeota archaeon LC_3]|nr:MAG: hypothetical protein HeimC3_35460 [Candidatus Heimdallarchaeota archaeon LC_3]
MIFFIFFLLIIDSNPSFSNITMKPENDSNFSLRNPIRINNNIEMENAGFSGTGTEIDPFIIEGFKIIDNYTRNLIDLRNVNHHVLIKNNFLSGTNFYGIALFESPNCKIINNTISNAGWLAINVRTSHNTIVEKNNIFNVGTGGIEIKNAQNVTFKDNTIRDSPGFGIKLDSAQNIIIENNLITNTSLQGIEIESIASITSNSLISNNSLFKTGGINLKGNQLKVVNNIINSPGAEPILWIDSGFHNNTISNNFITAQQGIFSDQSHNNQIYGNFFNTTANSLSLSSSINNSIMNNYLTGSISLYNINSSLVKQNIIIEPESPGLQLYFSSDNLLEANIVFNSSESGLLIDHGDLSTRKSLDNTIKNNLFANNSYHGVDLRLGAENNTIKFNDIVFNNIDFSSNQGYDDGEGNLFDQNYWGPNLLTVTLEGSINNKDLNPTTSFFHIIQTIISITDTDDDFVTLNWESGLAEYYNGTYELYYSTDQGINWLYIGSEPNFGYVFDATSFANKTQLSFKLRVSDVLGFYYEIELIDGHTVFRLGSKISETTQDNVTTTTQDNVTTNSLDMLFIFIGLITILIIKKKIKKGF